MSTEAELEFLKAFEMIKLVEEEPIEYRIHYDDNIITMCTMRNHPENTEYFVVDKETYDNYFSYKIINGKLEKIDNNPGYRVQLKKGTTGQRTVKNNASIALETNEKYNNIDHYEFKDN